MTEKHNHHFVPVRLIKRFMLPGKDPVLYVPAENKMLPASPQKIFSIRDFHAIDRGDEGVDYNSVEDILNIIEKAGAEAIEALASNIEITPQQRSDLANFWALQYLRTPLIRNGVESFLKEAIKVTGDILFETDPNMPPIPEPLRQFGHTFSALVENGGAVIKVAAWKSMIILKQVPTAAEDIFHMNWCLLDSKGDNYFVLSDNPCAFYDKHYLKHAYGVGTRNSGLELTMPVGKNQCLLASWEKIPKRTTATIKRVVEINRRAALFGDRFFAYPVQSNQMLEFLKKYSMERPETDITTIPTDKGRMIISRANTFNGGPARQLFSKCTPLFR